MSPISLRSLKGRFYEADKSTRDLSVMEMELGPRHIEHRFQVLGGISISDVLRENLSGEPSMFNVIAARKKA